MRLIQQRLRVLSLLGLPIGGVALAGCALAVTKEPTPEIPVVAIQVDDPTVDAGTGTDEPTVREEPKVAPRLPASHCARDEVRQFQCVAYATPPSGAMPPPFDHCASERTPGGRASDGSYGLWEGTSPRPSLAFDPPLTNAYRQGIAANRPADDPTHECCFSSCSSVQVKPSGEPIPPGYKVKKRCIDPLAQGSSHSAVGRGDCPAAVVFADGPAGSYAAPFDQTSTAQQGAPRKTIGFREVEKCCYASVRKQPPLRSHRSRPIPGRALRSASDQISTSLPIVSLQWHSAALEPAPANRDAGLAARWLQDAAYEHASVATFARLSLELLALGAPSDLVADCHRAALDEIEHARLCYALASRHGGEPRGPGPLPDALDPKPASLTRLVRETVLDGCIGESLAALLASRCADGALDPAERSTYRRLAADEQRHADLAWRTLAWALRQSPNARAALRDALAQLDGSPLEAYGDVSADAVGALRDDLVRDVVLPCCSALLASTST